MILWVYGVRSTVGETSEEGDQRGGVNASKFRHKRGTHLYAVYGVQ